MKTMGRFCCRSPSKIIGLTVYGEKFIFFLFLYLTNYPCTEMARRRAMVSALQQTRTGENNQDLVEIILKMELQIKMISSTVS